MDFMNDYLMHHGIMGMKWGVRRYQNADGTLTDAGKKRYGGLGTEKGTLRSVDKTAMRRAASQQVYFGKKAPGKNQQKVLERYRKEANELKTEKQLNELDKKGNALMNEYRKKKADGTWTDDSPLAREIVSFRQEYQKAQLDNSKASMDLARKYVKDMNKALVQDLGFEYVDTGADYLNNNRLGWDEHYLYNKAWFS